TPGVVSGADLEARGYIGTVLGEPPWDRRTDKNQAISAQPSERAREGPRRALHFPKRGKGTGGERGMTVTGALSAFRKRREIVSRHCGKRVRTGTGPCA